jgi:hypothetical protein
VVLYHDPLFLALILGIVMSTTTTCSTVVGIFATRAAAEKAFAELRAAGYREDQIGLIGKDSKGRVVKKGKADETNAGEGLGIGAAVGAVGGAAVGAGVIAGVIPVIGPVLAIGILGTVLLNAAGGAAIAGLAGALIGWGIPEEDAKFYEQQVHDGQYMVTVTGENCEEVWTMLSRHGGYNRTSSPLPLV